MRRRQTGVASIASRLGISQRDAMQIVDTNSQRRVGARDVFRSRALRGCYSADVVFARRGVQRHAVSEYQTNRQFDPRRHSIVIIALTVAERAGSRDTRSVYHAASAITDAGHCRALNSDMSRQPPLAGGPD